MKCVLMSFLDKCALTSPDQTHDDEENVGDCLTAKLQLQLHLTNRFGV